MRIKFYRYLKQDKLFNLHVYLVFVILGLVTLALTSQKVYSLEDLVMIEGEFDSISQQLNPGAKYRRVNYSSRDTLTFIHLKQYRSKFQISYTSYNTIEFIKTVKPGDKIIIHIAENDFKYLQHDENIRGFSLKVNDKSYSEPEYSINSLNGGKRLFLIISGIILVFVIYFITRKHKEWLKEPSL